MRQFTETEIQQVMVAERELDKAGLIIMDGSLAATSNALVLNEHFNNNAPVTVESIIAAAQALRAKLRWKSPAQIEFSEILARLEPAQCQVVNAWISKQRRLKTEDAEGLQNLNQVLSWLLNRRFSISEATLDMALTNVQNNSRRPLHWHDAPKESREYVQGRPNHAHSSHREEPKASVNEREYVNGRRNHAYAPAETVAQAPAEAPDAWQQIVNRYMTQWSTHSQKATLQAEYDRGMATGKSWREIGAALGRIVKGWERGR
jgi:hypothetical protein